MKKIFLINFLLLLILILLSEIFLKIYTKNGTKSFLGKRLYNYDTFMEYLPNFFESDKDQVFKLKKFKKKLLSFQDNSKYEVEIIDFKGVNLRKGGLNQEKSDEKIKSILLIGDSYTFGAYLDEKFTISSNLQKLLNFDDQNYNIINAGYASGFDPDQHYVFLVKNIKKFNPDIVIYGLFSGNDFIKYNKERWILKDKYNLPTKIINPMLSVKDGIIYNKKQDDSNVVGSKFLSIPILKNSFFYVTVMRFLEKNLFSLFDKSKDLDGPFPVLLNKDFNFSERLNVLNNIIKGMQRVSNQNKAEFVVLYHPINFEIYKEFLPNNKTYIRNLPKILKNNFKGYNNMHFIDPTDALKKSSLLTYPKNGEVHYNKNGSKIVAKEIFDYLNKFNLWIN
tara:strand:- start:2118 stop:3296 length:1179 start_codon:yes stop_codon:yes gene_type:complete